MECEKCQDRGFVEFEHGLIMQFCDCEKGQALGLEITGETPDLSSLMKEEEVTIDKNIGSEVLGQMPNEVIDDSSSGTEQPDKPIRSKDTSQPKRTRKSKKKKGTRKRAS